MLKKYCDKCEQPMHLNSGYEIVGAADNNFIRRAHMCSWDCVTGYSYTFNVTGVKLLGPKVIGEHGAEYIVYDSKNSEAVVKAIAEYDRRNGTDITGVSTKRG